MIKFLTDKESDCAISQTDYIHRVLVSVFLLQESVCEIAQLVTNSEYSITHYFI